MLTTRSALGSALVLFLACPAVSQATTYTGVKLLSSTNDYIGGGQKFTFLPPSATMSTMGGPGGVTIHVTLGEDWFYLHFLPQSNRTLHRGNFPGAANHLTTSPFTPGMDVFGDGRGCDQVLGWFNVRDFAMAQNGTVARLAIDFVQHCEITEPPLYGSVRFNSTIPLAVPNVRAIAGADFEVDERAVAALDGTVSFTRNHGPLSYQWSQIAGPPVVLDDPKSVAPVFTAPAVGLDGARLGFRLDVVNQAGIHKHDVVYVRVNSLSAPTTRLSFRGDAGDYITFGNSYRYSPNNSTMTFSSNYDGGVSVNVVGDTFWSLDVAAPGNAELTPGKYSGAQNFPFQATDQPGLSFDGDGRGCDTVTGSFTVYQAQFDISGIPEKLDLTFVQHCDGELPAAYGELLLDAVPHQ
jgi:hypothetical protein